MAPTSDSVAGARGYLKVDICVLSKGESPKIPDMVDDNDEIEGYTILYMELNVFKPLFLKKFVAS